MSDQRFNSISFEMNGIEYESRSQEDRRPCDGCAFDKDSDDYRAGCVDTPPCGGLIFVTKAMRPMESNSLAAPQPPKQMLLPSDPTERKGIPITTGVLDYFPLAIAEVAKCSKAGNDQHNPGQPLHWAKEKSTDHADCIPRHLIDRGTFDTDNVRHSAKLAWRALALLQIELEAAQ